MAWAIQYQTLPFNGSWSYTFNFPGGVSSYIVGIPYFYLTYGPGGTGYHAVQRIALSLGSPTGGQVQTSITVPVDATLSDSSGTRIDLDNSWVMVAVIAWTGAQNSDVVLQQATAVANHQSESMIVPSGTLSGLQSILSGFDLEYASTSSGEAEDVFGRYSRD